MVLAHVDVINRIHEDSRAGGHSLFIPILYDDMIRRQLAERAAKGDPELDLLHDLSRINKDVLERKKSL